MKIIPHQVEAAGEKVIRLAIILVLTPQQPFAQQAFHRLGEGGLLTRPELLELLCHAHQAHVANSTSTLCRQKPLKAYLPVCTQSLNSSTRYPSEPSPYARKYINRGRSCDSPSGISAARRCPRPFNRSPAKWRTRLGLMAGLSWNRTSARALPTPLG